MASATSSAPPLVLEPKELHALLQQNSRPIRILDATWFMPNVDRNAYAEFLRGPRVPGASFWDVDKVATLADEKDANGQLLNPLGLSHMLPSPDKFAKEAGNQGISHDTHVVVYDTHGVFSSPRTAFTFHAYGHPAVSILNGGLPGWAAEGFRMDEGEIQPNEQRNLSSQHYPIPSLATGMIRSYDEMVANARMGPRGQTVLDARPAARFDGVAPEPRPGLSSGHIPNSLSLPATTLTQSRSSSTGNTYTVLKQQTDLWRTIGDSVGGMDALDKLRQASSAGEPAATNTCGSGMTAAILWLGLHQLGIQSALYDESWTGYAQRKESVIDKTKE